MLKFLEISEICFVLLRHSTHNLLTNKKQLTGEIDFST